MTNEAEKAPLHQVSVYNIGLIDFRKFVRHECVPEVNDKVRLFRKLIGQRSFIKLNAGLLIEMRIGLHDKAKTTALGSTCMKTVLGLYGG